MRKKHRLGPSKIFHTLIDLHGGKYAASRTWGVEYNSINRFLKGTGSLTGDTIISIMEACKVPFDDLFMITKTHEK